MRELRLHRELYRGESIDEAVKVLAPFATFTLAEQPGYWVVQIEAATPARERRIALELGNHALGLTMRARK